MKREIVTYGRYEVGGSGGHSGSGGGRRIPECFGKEGPHHSVAGEKQAATQQPQRDMKLKDERRNLLKTDKFFSHHDLI